MDIKFPADGTKVHSCLSPPQPYSRSSRASGWGCDSKGGSGISSAVPSHGPSVLLARPELLSHHPEASGVWQTSVRGGGSSTGTGWPLPRPIIHAVLFPYQRLQCCSLWYWQLFYGQSLNHAGWWTCVSWPTWDLVRGRVREGAPAKIRKWARQRIPADNVPYLSVYVFAVRWDKCFFQINVEHLENAKLFSLFCLSSIVEKCASSVNSFCRCGASAPVANPA